MKEKKFQQLTYKETEMHKIKTIETKHNNNKNHL